MVTGLVDIVTVVVGDVVIDVVVVLSVVENVVEVLSVVLFDVNSVEGVVDVCVLLVDEVGIVVEGGKFVVDDELNVVIIVDDVVSAVVATVSVVGTTDAVVILSLPTLTAISSSTDTVVAEKDNRRGNIY